jgi:hypothetical protein
MVTFPPVIAMPRSVLPCVCPPRTPPPQSTVVNAFG